MYKGNQHYTEQARVFSMWVSLSSINDVVSLANEWWKRGSHAKRGSYRKGALSEMQKKVNVLNNPGSLRSREQNLRELLTVLLTVR
jgi:hypothetical protein